MQLRFCMVPAVAITDSYCFSKKLFDGTGSQWPAFQTRSSLVERLVQVRSFHCDLPCIDLKSMPYYCHPFSSAVLHNSCDESVLLLKSQCHRRPVTTASLLELLGQTVSKYVRGWKRIVHSRGVYDLYTYLLIVRRNYSNIIAAILESYKVLSYLRR